MIPFGSASTYYAASPDIPQDKTIQHGECISVLGPLLGTPGYTWATWRSKARRKMDGWMGYWVDVSLCNTLGTTTNWNIFAILSTSKLWAMGLTIFNRCRRKRDAMAVATRRDVATLTLCAAPTALVASPRTRPSSASLSATWSSLPPSVISARRLCTRVRLI